jgi:glycosyltransferase involved in cell wall biosynthesis
MGRLFATRWPHVFDGIDKRVGIVMPFFRSGSYLQEALESILQQQDAPSWQLYLVNDGSDQNDVEIAAAYSRQYPDKIQLLHHPGGRRRGISASRNLGIRTARNELIAFLDADDTWYPHKLRFQVGLLDRHASAKFTFGSALRWFSWNGGEDYQVPASVDGHKSDSLVPGDALLRTFLRDESLTPCTGSVLIRRSALQECGAFEDAFWGLYDDQVLYAKLCLSGNIYVSSQCLSRYRKHSQSCCGQAAAAGTADLERSRFLSWLEAYQQLTACVS